MNHPLVAIKTVSPRRFKLSIALVIGVTALSYLGYKWLSRTQQNEEGTLTQQPTIRPFYPPLNNTNISSVVVPRVVLLGDSITEGAFTPEGGWAVPIAARLSRTSDVLLRGFSGYNTKTVRAFFPSIFATFGDPVVAIVLMLGTNDGGPGIMNLGLTEYKENLVWIVEYMKVKGFSSDKIILMSPPVYDGEKVTRTWNLSSPIDNNVMLPYVEACQAVAAEVGCEFLNLHEIMKSKHETTWRDLLSDGIHLSALGSQVVAEAVWPLIEKRTKDLPVFLPDALKALEHANNITG